MAFGGVHGGMFCLHLRMMMFSFFFLGHLTYIYLTDRSLDRRAPFVQLQFTYQPGAVLSVLRILDDIPLA